MTRNEKFAVMDALGLNAQDLQEYVERLGKQTKLEVVFVDTKGVVQVSTDISQVKQILGIVHGGWCWLAQVMKTQPKNWYEGEAWAHHQEIAGVQAKLPSLAAYWSLFRIQSLFAETVSCLQLHGFEEVDPFVKGLYLPDAEGDNYPWCGYNCQGDNVTDDGSTSKNYVNEGVMVRAVVALQDIH